MFDAEIRFDGDLFNGRALSEARQVVKKDITKASLVLEGELARNTPVGGTGVMRRSWFFKVNETASDITGVVSNPVEYALPVELGRKPAPVPITPLTQWVKRKLGVTGDAARSVAYAISKKKSRRRTPGQFFARDTFDATLPKLNQILDQTGANIVRSLEL